MEESQSHCPEGQGVTVERGNREEFIKEIGGERNPSTRTHCLTPALLIHKQQI
jgi:hypothetical protein